MKNKWTRNEIIEYLNKYKEDMEIRLKFPYEQYSNRNLKEEMEIRLGRKIEIVTSNFLT